MSILNELIKNLVVCVIVINIVDCMIISKDYGKYIKLFTGILVIIVVLNSGEIVMNKMVNGKAWTTNNKVGTNKRRRSISQSVGQTNDNIKIIQDKINKQYQKEIVEQLEKEHIVKVKKIRIKEDRDNKVDTILLHLKVLKDSKVDNNYREIVCNIVSNYYDVGKENVIIRFV